MGNLIGILTGLPLRVKRDILSRLNQRPRGWRWHTLCVCASAIPRAWFLGLILSFSLRRECTPRPIPFYKCTYRLHQRQFTTTRAYRRAPFFLSQN